MNQPLNPKRIAVTTMLMLAFVASIAGSYYIGRTQGPGIYPSAAIYAGAPGWPRMRITLEDSPWDPLSNPNAQRVEAVRHLAAAGMPAAKDWMAGYYHSHQDPAQALAYERAAYQSLMRQLDAMPHWMSKPDLWPVLP
ncbi:MAG: hypothetical protein KGL42_07110 [Betaproteobacteria bacterium]|nr:hypothetical protein [Betaproteobacteria bacterium]